jgi:hypothetical protein
VPGLDLTIAAAAKVAAAVAAGFARPMLLAIPSFSTELSVVGSAAVVAAAGLGTI